MLNFSDNSSIDPSEIKPLVIEKVIVKAKKQKDDIPFKK